MLSNPTNFHKYFINSRTNKNIIKKNKISMQQWNRLQSSSLHSIPSTNIFRIPHKCIHMHIHEEFTIRSHIQAYKGDMNIYGPLWTPTCICAMWTYSLCFFLSYSSQKTLSSPTSSPIAWQTFPITTASCMTSPPYILLFTQHSPVICKDFFPFVYMYKSSRYYAVVQINLGPMFPRSTSL